MDTTTIKELLSLSPSSLIELWVLDGSTMGNTDLSFKFFDGISYGWKPLVFAGQTYQPFPIKIEQMDIDSKALVRPKLTVANINGFMSMIALANQSLVGATVRRIRVFVRSIDAVNFPNNENPWGTPDPTAIVSDQTFYVNRKIAENKDYIQFELCSPIEIDNVQLPRRMMLASNCVFVYRDLETCGYTGLPKADKNNKPFGAGGYGFTLNPSDPALIPAWDINTTYNQGDCVYMLSTLLQTYGNKLYYVCSQNGTVGLKPSESSVWIADACPRSPLACRLRFGNQPLRMGAFPGLAKSSFINTR